MEKEKIDYYIEYILDFFRRTGCKEGQGLMLRTIVFSAEKTFTRPQMNNLDFIFNVLRYNDYLAIKENDFIILTEKGADVITDIDVIYPFIALDSMIDIQQKSKEEIFNSLWLLIGPYKDDNTLFYTEGPLYYNTIRPYLTHMPLPASYSEYMEELNKCSPSTSRGKWYRSLFIQLKNDTDVSGFLKDLSHQLNEIIKDIYTPKIDDTDNLWVTIDTPAVTPIQQEQRINEASIQYPLALISYAWEIEDEEYMKWIEDFAKDLREHGIDAQIDKYQHYGADVVGFMRDSIRNAEKVLCILTPKYKDKAESGNGGAAYEGAIISHEIYNNQGTTKFIPILRKGTFKTSTPDFIGGRKGFDCTTSDKYQNELMNIVSVIKGEPIVEIPPIQ